MTSDLPTSRQCSLAGTCELSRRFRPGGRNVWKTFYCAGNFERCARYQRSVAGEAVPANLLPNGKLLEVTRRSVEP